MALTVTLLDYGAIEDNTSISVTTASIAPSDGSLVGLWVSVKEPGTTGVVDTSPTHGVTGLGTLTERGSELQQLRSNNAAMLQEWLWSAMQTGSSGAGGTITFGFDGADPPGAIFWAVFEISSSTYGVDSTTIRNSKSGTTTASIDMTLSPALAANEKCIAFVLAGGKPTSPGTDVAVGSGETLLQKWYVSGSSYDSAFASTIPTGDGGPSWPISQ